MTDSDQSVQPDQPESDSSPVKDKAIWMRGFAMLVLAICFAVAETILVLLAILQFGWMLFSGKRNPAIGDMGGKLATWLADVTKFQTAASDDRPFPWSDKKSTG